VASDVVRCTIIDLSSNKSKSRDNANRNTQVDNDDVTVIEMHYVCYAADRNLYWMIVQ